MNKHFYLPTYAGLINLKTQRDEIIETKRSLSIEMRTLYVTLDTNNKSVLFSLAVELLFAVSPVRFANINNYAYQ